MDANEFFNNLFSQLEDRLKSSEEEKLLNQVFGGELTNQLIAKECGHRSERLEPFYRYPPAPAPHAIVLTRMRVLKSIYRDQE